MRKNGNFFYVNYKNFIKIRMLISGSKMNQDSKVIRGHGAVGTKRAIKLESLKTEITLRMNVMGLICPRTGEFFAIETSHSDTETFQAFLTEANASIKLKRPKNIMILNNASWHKKKTLDYYDWKPKFFPPYSPDFNPIERIWNVMKARWFNNYVCRNAQQLMDRLDQAILDIINHPKKNQKTTSIGTLF